MDNSIKTKFLGVTLKSPLVLPAGVLDISFSSMQQILNLGAGLVTTKSLTIEPRKGHEGPVVVQVAGGILNAMGLCNPGIEDGIKEVAHLKSISNNCSVNLSVFATTVEDFVILAKKVNDSNADFIELNLSCPNVMDEFGEPLSASEKTVKEIIKSVKGVCNKPVIAKLSPNVTNFIKIALAAEYAGADALCMINTLGPGMEIDIEASCPVLSNVTGGLSGPCVRPVALKLVYECRKAGIQIPIIGMGGITNGEDAIKMFIAGANLIGVGTAVYYRGVDVFDKINKEIVSFLKKKELKTIKDISTIF